MNTSQFSPPAQVSPAGLTTVRAASRTFGRSLFRLLDPRFASIAVVALVGSISSWTARAESASAENAKEERVEKAESRTLIGEEKRREKREGESTTAVSSSETARASLTPASSGFGSSGLSPQITTSSPFDFLGYGYNRQHQGWISNEPVMTPTNVGSITSFGELWNSPQLASATVGGKLYPPHMYAVPVYVDNVTLTAGPYVGLTTSVVYAGTTNGDLYAISAAASNFVPAGTVLWNIHLGNADNNTLDNVPRGVLATPFVNPSAAIPVIYVVTDVANIGWEAFAVNLSNGTILTGWPIVLNDSTIQQVLENGSSAFISPQSEGQRGALNVSADGTQLYIPFGDYNDGANGFLIDIDTTKKKVVSVYAGGANPGNGAPNAGMWAAGGPSIDLNGNIYISTGNEAVPNPSSKPYPLPLPGAWGMSVLQFSSAQPLNLIGTYSPWNYQIMDVNDVDLCGSGVIVLPDLNQGSTTHCVVIGGKQGNMYLLNRDAFPGGLSTRPTYFDSGNVQHALSDLDASFDQSLLPPGPFSYYKSVNNSSQSVTGPLNVFGPYSETGNATIFAKSRTTPAVYQTSDGSTYIVHTGETKQSAGSSTVVPPCIARVKVVTSPSAAPYLSIDSYEQTQTYLSPGSPIVTSNGMSNYICWNLDTGGDRGAGLDANSPYIVAANVNQAGSTFGTLFRSASGTLHRGGKYNEPSSARGKVFVGTDRIQTFGVMSNVIAISAGGTASGKYVADAYFSGGSTTSTASGITTSGVTNPAPPSVYQHARTGTFSYVFPGLSPGTSYSVRLHFSDPTSTGTGQRQFNVAINGLTVLTNYDIFSTQNNGTASNANIARAEPFNAVADANGNITVAFTLGAAGTPMVSGIEVNNIPDSPAQEQWDDWLASNGLFNAQAPTSAPLLAQAGPNSNPANDGIGNLFKYAAGVSPTVRDQTRVSVPQMAIVNSGGSNFLQFTYQQSTTPPTGLTYTIETTPTFSPSNWTPQVATVVRTVSNGPSTVLITLKCSTAVTPGANLFARLRINLAP